jgi:hypothetical protein
MPENQNCNDQFHLELDEKLDALEKWAKSRTTDVLILYLVAVLRLEISGRIANSWPGRAPPSPVGAARAE